MTRLDVLHCDDGAIVSVADLTDTALVAAARRVLGLEPPMLTVDRRAGVHTRAGVRPDGSTTRGVAPHAVTDGHTRGA